MSQDESGLMVRVKWKLEKFDGEKGENDSPVEVLEGEELIPLAQFEEMKNGTD